MTLLRRILVEKRALIYPLLGALVFNAGLLIAVVYPLSQKVAGGEQQAEQARIALDSARRDHAAAHLTVSGKDSADEELKKFYSAVLPPDFSRARRIIFAKVEQLAQTAGVHYEQGKYDTARERESELGKLSVSVVLTGQYRDIRRLIYELETAPEFLILENVALSQRPDGDGGLNVNVQVSTYYRADDDGR